MANGLRPVELAGARIKLRRLRDADAQKLFDGYFSSSDASRFLGRKAHASVDQTRAVLEQRCRWDEGAPMADFGWIIAGVTDDEPVGILYSMVKDDAVEIHYGIGVAHWNKGLASEAVRLAADWLISQAGVSRAWTAVDCDHIATQRVLQKAGFEEEGRLKDWLVLPAFDGGGMRDAVRYGRVKAR